MATQTELRHRALIKLGVASRHMAPSDPQDKDMQAAYLEVYLKLQDMNIAFWGETDDVPDEVANEVASLMAWSRNIDYGVSGDRFQRLAAEAPAAFRRIRLIAVNPYDSINEVEDF